MRRLLWITLIAAMVAGHACCAEPSEDPERVGVWYITEFYDASWKSKHWAEVRSRTWQNVPIGAPESSTDPKVMERQYRQMRECGIDYILMDDTNGVGVDDTRICGVIRAWFDFMDAKPADQRIPIAVAVGGELNQWRDRAAWLKAVDYEWNNYAQRPSYLRVNGRPVFHWYLEKDDVWPDWDDSRWLIHRNYNFFRMDGQLKYGGWGYGTDSFIHDIKECQSLQPGWDLSPPGFDREGGEYYRRKWINALECQARHILIACWNGWAEGNAIEDSYAWKDTYGHVAPTWYRLMTQGYIAAYKGRLVNRFYYRDKSSPHIYLWNGKTLRWVSAYPHRVPVIVLPSGLLGKLAHSKLPEPGAPDAGRSTSGRPR